MNVVKENRPDQTAVLTVTVAQADYTEAVEKALKDYKRKANVPGFRPGMVPMGVINKMYRKGVTAEEAYRVASKGCFDYIEAQKSEYIGDVLPSEEQKPLDFDNNVDHEFIFEIGLAPEVKIALSDKDKVESYKIKVTKEMRDGYRSNYLRRFGRLVDVDVVEKEEAINVTLDNEAMHIEEAYVGLIGMSDEERAPFIGKKEGDKMTVNVNELYKTPSQRASILQMKEEELAAINPIVELTITKIRKFAEPEINDEFFRMAFPEGEVKSAKEFDAFIDSQIEKELETHTRELFGRTMQRFLLDKAALTLPDAFMKRWLQAMNEGRFSLEEIDRDYPAFASMMKWNIVQKYYVDTLNIAITEEELIDEAKQYALAQFAQYGMPSVGEEMLANYAKSILENKQEAKKIQEKLFENKVIAAVTPLVKVVEKSVSPEEFGKKVEELNQ